MDSWKKSFVFGWLPGRCELLVSGSVIRDPVVSGQLIASPQQQGTEIPKTIFVVVKVI